MPLGASQNRMVWSYEAVARITLGILGCLPELRRSAHNSPATPYMLATRPIATGTVPVASATLNLPQFIVENLKAKGIESLFPAQAEVVPFLLREGYNHDICVMSPTGTGKTLAYAIPIVKRLYSRVIPRIRGLVVLPSHDLAMQVKSVFDYLARGTELKICALGANGLKDEQAVINDVDILIATPGRLQSHIDLSENFTLQHLEFLVFDEADKLLSNFAPWVATVFPSIYNNKLGFINVPFTNGYSMATQFKVATTRVSHTHPKAFENSPPLYRWLFSATLTSQSAQIVQLHLHSPIFFTTTTSTLAPTSINMPTTITTDLLILKYQFPKNLKQYYIIEQDNKHGVVLVSLLKEILAKKSTAKIACFARSIDACHRLYTILQLLQPEWTILEFFASLGGVARAKALDAFEKGLANIMVCSDLMARGLDVSQIDVIINYDIPEHIKAYVHRVGRTARGLNTGTAYSIIDPLKKEEFLKMVQKAENLNIDEKIFDLYDDELLVQFQNVLPKLQQSLRDNSRVVKKIKL